MVSRIYCISASEEFVRESVMVGQLFNVYVMAWPFIVADVPGWAIRVIDVY